ncbi:MAG: FeoB-associated Cys-rich membrane protein [Lentisphaeria bacterium]|nr:FeoB-associated Cys-rich membrane protein [Lentisphaeria bacterium]
MTWGNLIAGTVVVLMIAAALTTVIRRKKRGGCVGCDECRRDCTFRKPEK